MSLKLEGKVYETDEEGFLTNLNDWNPEIATIMAEVDKIELTNNHWEVIHFLREYYEEYQFSPTIRVLIKAIRKRLGNDKGNSIYLYKLFPNDPIKPTHDSIKQANNPIKQASKYAGLPKPTRCI